MICLVIPILSLLLFIQSLSKLQICSFTCGCSFSGDKQTTVDYSFADVEATSMISHCRALPMEDLNTSDHLPLLADMLYTLLREENACHVLPRVDWEQAAKTGMIDEYDCIGR